MIEIEQNQVDLLEAYGWQIIPSKNVWMWSFIKADRRLNIYFTTGTVTAQGKDGYYKSFTEIHDLTKLEIAIKTIICN